MANVNTPYGLKPLMRTMSGGQPQAYPFVDKSSDTGTIFKWDPVIAIIESTGTAVSGPASSLHTMVPGTDYYLGVSLNWSGSGGSEAATHNYQVLISPDALFEAQTDVTGFAINNQLYKANLTITTAGGGVTRDNSGVFLGSINTTATLDVLLIKLADHIDNAYGAYAKVELMFNRHQLQKTSPVSFTTPTTP